MHNSTARGDGYTVTIEHDVSTHEGMEDEPDPSWRFIDAAGHVHEWVDGSVPTVETVFVGTYWCEECADEHEEWGTRCTRCGEPIAPRTRSVLRRHHLITGRTITATFTRDFPDFDRIVAAAWRTDGSHMTVGPKIDIDLPHGIRLIGAIVTEVRQAEVFTEDEVTVQAESVETVDAAHAP